MSDSIGKVGSAGQVSSSSSVGAVRNDALAEVQYYNLKAIGTSRPVASGDGAFDVPQAGAVNAYAGDPQSTAVSGTTRSALASSTAPAAQMAGNPWMAPPQAAHSTPPPAPSPTSSSSDVSPTDDDDAPKQPWHADSNPVTYRDMDFDERDDRPADTWAPNANRSAEFAALDNMKLTTPEEALAQWRAQKERAAQSSPAPYQASSPAPPTQQASTYVPAAEAPSSGAPGNPWQAPQGQKVTTGGLTMPPATPGPQLAPPASAQAFNPPGPAAPVDLSAGSYVNPNLTSAHNIPAPTSSAPSNPPFRPTNIMPNIPYVTEPQQGMTYPQPYQNRFQAMVNNLSMGGVAGMGMPGMGMPGMGMPGMGMPGMGMPGMGFQGFGSPTPSMNLFGDDDTENDAANDDTFGMFGNGNQRRSGPGASMLWQLGGFGQ